LMPSPLLRPSIQRRHFKLPGSRATASAATLATFHPRHLPSPQQGAHSHPPTPAQWATCSACLPLQHSKRNLHQYPHLRRSKTSASPQQQPSTSPHLHSHQRPNLLHLYRPLPRSSTWARMPGDRTMLGLRQTLLLLLLQLQLQRRSNRPQLPPPNTSPHLPRSRLRRCQHLTTAGATRSLRLCLSPRRRVRVVVVSACSKTKSSVAGVMRVRSRRAVGRSREAWEGTRMICLGTCGVRFVHGISQC